MAAVLNPPPALDLPVPAAAAAAVVVEDIVISAPATPADVVVIPCKPVVEPAATQPGAGGDGGGLTASTPVPPAPSSADATPVVEAATVQSVSTVVAATAESTAPVAPLVHTTDAAAAVVEDASKPSDFPAPTPAPLPSTTEANDAAAVASSATEPSSIDGKKDGEGTACSDAAASEAAVSAAAPTCTTTDTSNGGTLSADTAAVPPPVAVRAPPPLSRHHKTQSSCDLDSLFAEPAAGSYIPPSFRVPRPAPAPAGAGSSAVPTHGRRATAPTLGSGGGLYRSASESSSDAVRPSNFFAPGEGIGEGGAATLDAVVLPSEARFRSHRSSIATLPIGAELETVSKGKGMVSVISRVWHRFSYRRSKSNEGACGCGRWDEGVLVAVVQCLAGFLSCSSVGHRVSAHPC